MNTILDTITIGVILLPYIECVIAIVQHAMGEDVGVVRVVILPTTNGLDQTTVVLPTVQVGEQVMEILEDSMLQVILPADTATNIAVGAQVGQQLLIV